MKIVENIIIRDTAGDSADVTAAGALKVDGSAVAQPVTDNGASLTVDAVSLPLPTGAATETTLDAIKTAIETLDNAISGTEIQADIVAPLPAGTNTIGAVKITDGVDETDVLNLANSNPLVVAIVDTNGDQIASFGGGTQYPEGTVDATATGTLALMEAAGDTMVPVQGTVADGLLVNLGSNNDVTVTGSVTANAGTDLNTSALALEATLQSVKTAVEIIDNIVSGSEAQVDIVAPLPSGTNNIGDVDILSVPAPLNVVGSGLEATALRVTIATDSTGVVSIDDNGSSITVDGTVSVSGSVAVTGPLTDTELRATPVPISGTVTANAGTNLNTSALALETTATSIKNAVEVIDNAIAGTEMQVDVVAPLPAGTNNIGDVDVLSLPSIPAGTNNIGDVDIASIATGDNAIGRVKLTDGTDVADILDLTNSNSLAVAIVDGTGNQITSFGGGQQYTEGATDATITGTAMMMEGAGDTLLPVQGTVADGLLVNLGGNNDVTVTGSVTANAGTNLNTSALALETTASAIKTAVEIIDNAIAGTEMQVDIVSMPPVTATDLDIRNLTATDVVTAELSAVDNAVLDAIAASVAAIDTDTSTIIGHVDGLETLIGTTNTNTGNSATALQLIDDTVATLGTDTYTEAATKGLVIGAVRRDADTTLVDTTNEISPLQVDANGRLKVEAFSGETLPVSLASTTVTGTVAVTQSGTWDEVGINDSGNSITVDDGGVSLTVDGSVSITGTVDTELPAAAALADDTANPTLPSVGTFPHWYDGATWDRAKGDSTDGLLVNLGANNDITGTVTANAGTNLNTSALALETTASAIKTAVELLDDAIVTDDTAFTPATTKVLMAGFEYDDITPDSVDEGDGGAARMSANRNIYTQIRDAAGNERGVNVNASNQLSVSVDNNAAITKTVGTSVLSLQSIAANGVVISNDITVTSLREVTFYIHFGRRSATAAGAGVNIRIEASSKSSGIGHWYTLATFTTEFAACSGTTVSGTEAAGQTAITLTSGTGFTAGDIIFFDNGTIGNSEWHRIKSVSGATITIEETAGIVNAQTGASVYDAAQMFVAELNVRSKSRLRVVVDGSSFTQAFAIEVDMTSHDLN